MIEGTKLDSISIDENIIGVIVKNVPDKKGMLASHLIDILKVNINIDVMVQSKSKEGKSVEIFFTTTMDKAEQVKDVLTKSKVVNENNEVFDIIDSIIKINIEGIGLKASSEYTLTIYNELKNNGINILSQTCSESSICLIVDGIKGKETKEGIKTAICGL